MQHNLDEMMHGHNADDGAIYALQTQLAAAKNHLQGYKDVEATINSKDGPKRLPGAARRIRPWRNCYRQPRHRDTQCDPGARHRPRLNDQQWC